jgi:prepilin signal peptidase PulO-like enzyme (type II secretory pathway)
VGGARDPSRGHPPPRTRSGSAELSGTPETAAGAAESVEPDDTEPGSRPEEDGPTGFALVRALPRERKIAVAAISIVLAAACFARFGLTGRAVVGAVFCAVLVLLTATDLERRLIPNVIVLPALVVLLAAQIALYPDKALEWVLSSLFAALFLFVPMLVYPTGMGMGDVKLAALLGAVLGKSVAVAILIAIVAGALFSVGLLLKEGMGARKRAFAYGPFLAFGGVVVLLLGGR